MDIKSKNKYRYIIIFIICSYMFGLSKLAVDDVIKNRDYLGSEPYFNSSRFRIELISYANNIEALNTIYKDYSQKSDEYKVTKAELLNSKSLYDSSLRMRNIEIDEKYKKDILEAENDANKDKFNRLTEARAKELEELKKKNTKTLEDFKKEIIAYKNKDYEYIKRAVRETSEIKYFITRGKNNVIDSNAKMDVSDIDLYIKNNALYSIKLPEQSYNNDQNKALGSLNKWLINTFQEGYFIIPKDIKHTSFIYRNYIYYNTVKQRIITEVVIWFVSFIIGLFLLIYLFKKNNEDLTFIEGLTKWYNKVPLDLRILIFIIYSYKIDRYINKTVFFHSPYNLNQIYILTVIAAYIFYFFINVRVVINLKRNKEEFRVELKRSLLFRMSNYIKHSPRAQSTKFKVRGIMILTLLLGVITICLFISLLLDSNDSAGIILLSIVYIFCYMILMLVYIFKSDRYLGMILKGTEEIVIGNLNYTINVKGRGDLSKLAHNINNMKSSFKKALENEIKSERLKSELITNVSHDLKTPLTSIITYVDLLKKEDLSKEESEGYIEILDRKSQRLKVLIDDLFEASKMASGAVELNIEKVEITSLLQQTLAELDEKINKSSLTFRLKVPETKVYANLDGKRTWRVFENLINNILKYSQPNTRVYIDLMEQGDKIIITLKNISSYEMDFDKDEIFERFKRGDKSRNTEGSGLGLAIAKSILELQGGNLSIEVDGDLFKAKVIIPSVAIEGSSI